MNMSLEGKNKLNHANRFYLKFLLLLFGITLSLILLISCSDSAPGNVVGEINITSTHSNFRRIYRSKATDHIDWKKDKLKIKASSSIYFIFDMYLNEKEKQNRYF